MDENLQEMVEELSKKRIDLTTCKKCYKICKSKQGLSNHHNTCLKTGASFLKNERIDLNLLANPKVVSSDDKILPLSQPLYTERDQPSNRSNDEVDDPNLNVDPDCSICWNHVNAESRLACDKCKNFFHYTCLFITEGGI